MSFVGVRISLLSAPDDPPVDNGALQATFGKFRQFLRICDIPVSTPMFYQDVETEGAAEGYAGEFVVPLPQTLLPPLSTIVSAWLEQRPGRTVQLRIGKASPWRSRRTRPRAFYGRPDSFGLCPGLIPRQVGDCAEGFLGGRPQWPVS